MCDYSFGIRKGRIKGVSAFYAACFSATPIELLFCRVYSELPLSFPRPALIGTNAGWSIFLRRMSNVRSANIQPQLMRVYEPCQPPYRLRLTTTRRSMRTVGESFQDSSLLSSLQPLAVPSGIGPFKLPPAGVNRNGRQKSIFSRRAERNRNGVRHNSRYDVNRV